jgi:hypothetical protein
MVATGGFGSPLTRLKITRLRGRGHPEEGWSLDLCSVPSIRGIGVRIRSPRQHIAQRIGTADGHSLHPAHASHLAIGAVNRPSSVVGTHTASGPA